MAKVSLLVFGLLLPFTLVLSLVVIGAGESTASLFFIVLGYITAISIPAALIFYEVHVWMNKRIKKDRKYLWSALLFFGNILVYPVYWYLYLWRESEAPLPRT